MHHSVLSLSDYLDRIKKINSIIRQSTTNNINFKRRINYLFCYFLAIDFSKLLTILKLLQGKNKSQTMPGIIQSIITKFITLGQKRLA